MKRSISGFAVGGLIALILGLFSVGLVATFVYLNGRPGNPVEDVIEPVVPDGAA